MLYDDHPAEVNGRMRLPRHPCNFDHSGAICAFHYYNYYSYNDYANTEVTATEARPLRPRRKI